jgi:hypothetical protein
MSTPPDIIWILQQIFTERNLEAERCADALSTVTSLARELTTGLAMAAVLGLCLGLALLFVYRPRLGRGSLWVPLFGLCGGAPTLYMHTRPASVCGWITHSKRRKAATKHSTRSNHSHAGGVARS